MSMRSIKSAERTLALFELFSAREVSLRVGEIAAALSIPQPSATMILRNLTDLGYLDYDPATRRYGPTVRVALLGSWMTRRHREVGNLPEEMATLHEVAGGATVWLAVQRGTAVRYIATIQASQPNRLRVNTDHKDPITWSASGRALLSLLGPRDLPGWIRRSNVDWPEAHFKIRERNCLAIVEAVRNRGYAETSGEIIPGNGALSIAVTSPIGEAPIAIGVGGPIAKIDARRHAIVESLLATKAQFAPETRI